MRKLASTFAFVAVLGLYPALSPHAAMAADGCSYGPLGNIVCAPGARPGLPYGPGFDYGYQNDYYRGDYRARSHRGSGRQGGLAYYCRLGSQTPLSMRDDCRRAGYW